LRGVDRDARALEARCEGRETWLLREGGAGDREGEAFGAGGWRAILQEEAAMKRRRGGNVVGEEGRLVTSASPIRRGVLVRGPAEARGCEGA
jgi:hypothetical protein